MDELEKLEFDSRICRRRIGAPDPDGRCVVYWMQRAQRADDNPALNVAIEAANLLGKPVLVYFQLLPRVQRAQLRHYVFMLQGFEDLGAGLRRR